MQVAQKRCRTLLDITKGSKADVEYWIQEFNNLVKSIKKDKFQYHSRVEYMDLIIFKGNRFYQKGLFDIKIFQKEQNLYSYIPQKSNHKKHTIELMKELVFEYKTVISNADFIIDLLGIVLENSLMEFHGEYFQQIFGILMGTNVAPVLANLYLAKLEKILKEKSINDPTMVWPIFFKRYIYDGFGITKGSKTDVEYWIQEFNNLVKSIK